MKTLKMIALAAFAYIVITTCCCMSGCNSIDDKYFVNPQNVQTNALSGKSFNEEIYVWESFIFPTNRTTGVK